MRYRDEGADELVFYDITASAEGRSLDVAWVRRIAEVIDIPFAVAGGVRTRDQAAACLDNGADKVSINSPALERPELIEELARDFGSQCVVLGVDSFARDGDYFIHQYTGSVEKTRDTGLRTLDWVREACARGAGEVVLNCMAQDGVRRGYDIPHTAAVIDSRVRPRHRLGRRRRARAFSRRVRSRRERRARRHRLPRSHHRHPRLEGRARRMRDRDAPLSAAEVEALAWDKMDGLLPAIVQDADTGQVLMLGYMNADALRATLDSGLVTFWSRSKGRLWTKGRDLRRPAGAALRPRRLRRRCAAGAGRAAGSDLSPRHGELLHRLWADRRRLARPARPHRLRTLGGRPAESYTAKLLAKGPVRIAQKVGEEGVEVALAAATGDRAGCISETADLLYHLTVLMQSQGFGWDEVTAELQKRHVPSPQGGEG
jgi:phosphoribosyl-ATP pyrophosphohydrolase